MEILLLHRLMVAMALLQIHSKDEMADQTFRVVLIMVQEAGAAGVLHPEFRPVERGEASGERRVQVGPEEMVRASLREEVKLGDRP